MTPERLREIRERCEKATKGPWEIRETETQLCISASHFVPRFGKGGPKSIASKVSWTRGGREDFAFIAHARQDVPDLLDEIERLRAEVEKATYAFEHEAFDHAEAQAKPPDFSAIAAEIADTFMMLNAERDTIEQILRERLA